MGTNSIGVKRFAVGNPLKKVFDLGLKSETQIFQGIMKQRLKPSRFKIVVKRNPGLPDIFFIFNPKLNFRGGLDILKKTPGREKYA
jgi:hypothetical protein